MWEGARKEEMEREVDLGIINNIHRREASCAQVKRVEGRREESSDICGSNFLLLTSSASKEKKVRRRRKGNGRRRSINFRD